MALPELHRVLAYKHDMVLKLYQQNYPNNILPAEQAFEETLKYLWLSKKHELDLINQPNNSAIPPRCIMLRSMREIDEMWHEFILFTQDYTEFCEKYFGEYLHHLPNIFDTMPVPREQMQKEIALLLPYICDHLGEDTLRTWFAIYIQD